MQYVAYELEDLNFKSKPENIIQDKLEEVYYMQLPEREEGIYLDSKEAGIYFKKGENDNLSNLDSS